MKEFVISKNLKLHAPTRVDNDRIREFLIKHLWVYPLFVAVVYSISSFFMTAQLPRIITSLILGYFPWRESMKKIFSGNYKHMRTQLLILLQVLTTSVSSGYSIEKSLTLIRPVIEHSFGSRSILINPLITLENNIKVHMNLDKALDIFSREIDFPETIPIFHALAISSDIGNNSLAILRSSCQMLSEMNAVQNEISAANAGKNAEAVMLCIMPFMITAALDKMGGGYLETARLSKVGSVILIAAFTVGVIAAALLFRFMTHSEKPVKVLSDDPASDTTPETKTPLTDILHRFMPTEFIASRHELFNEISMNPRISYERYLKKQLITCFAVLAASLTVLYIAKIKLIFAPLLAIGIGFLGVYDVRKNAELRREELMRDMPLFLCLIYTLLEAGLQLPKAIEICSYAFKDSNGLSSEIRNLRAMMLSGMTSSDAVERLSLRIQIPEAQSALLLVARYGRLGTSEVLGLLSLQASACWNLCRNAARKKQEREALGLLFPMTLDFLCVLMVATTPAIISLGI
ncbi:MAG: hypothetical protein J6127_04865 [Clostridiales bacterium]|nr:hypothetical protein [Clostridiales bacterium]